MRIYKWFDEINEMPVVFHWKYRMEEIDLSEEVKRGIAIWGSSASRQPAAQESRKRCAAIESGTPLALPHALGAGSWLRASSNRRIAPI